MTEISSLVERYSDELFAYLVRYTGDRSLAEDLLSDVFVRLLENQKKVQSTQFNIRAWLYKVATNIAISHHRKMKIRRFVSLENVRLKDKKSSPEAKASGKEEKERVRAAVLNLSLKLRSVIIMNIYQGMSYEEIGDALKINIGTVKSRLNEAKRKIREFLEESDE